MWLLEDFRLYVWLTYFCWTALAWWGWANYSLPPAFINKVLLVHSYAHLFTDCLHCLHTTIAHLSGFNKDSCVLKSWKYLLHDLLQKVFGILWLKITLRLSNSFIITTVWLRKLKLRGAKKFVQNTFISVVFPYTIVSFILFTYLSS